MPFSRVLRRRGMQLIQPDVLATDPFVPLQAIALSGLLDRLISSRLSDPVLLLI